MPILRSLVFVAALSFALPAIADRMPVVNGSSVATPDSDTFWLLGAGIGVVAAFRRHRRQPTMRDAMHRFTTPRRAPSREQRRGAGSISTSQATEDGQFAVLQFRRDAETHPSIGCLNLLARH